MSSLKPLARICLLPRVSGVGGMVTFNRNFTSHLSARNIQVTLDVTDTPFDALLIIGGSRQLWKLWQLHRKGVRLVQRLDGMNWLHRLPNQTSQNISGLRHYLRAEFGNLLLSTIRTHVADRVIYQSHFAKQWWEQVYGSTSKPSIVIHNGVDLDLFSPAQPPKPPTDRYRLLMVEGNLMGGYELGLDNGIKLAQSLTTLISASDSPLQPKPVELQVIGRVSRQVVEKYATIDGITLTWQGSIPWDKLPGFYRTAHLLFSADIHPACPNAVIEALACGLPVVAFDTGAVAELVSVQAGRVVLYGSNSWLLEQPDFPTLAKASLEILNDPAPFSKAARSRAELAFDLEHMIDAYVKVLLEN